MLRHKPYHPRYRLPGATRREVAAIQMMSALLGSIDPSHFHSGSLYIGLPKREELERMAEVAVAAADELYGKLEKGS